MDLNGLQSTSGGQLHREGYVLIVRLHTMARLHEKHLMKRKESYDVTLSTPYLPETHCSFTYSVRVSLFWERCGSASACKVETRAFCDPLVITFFCSGSCSGVPRSCEDRESSRQPTPPGFLVAPRHIGNALIFVQNGNLPEYD